MDKSYFVWPLEMVLEEAGDRRDEVLGVLKMADQLSAHFGMVPASRPIFFSWAEAIPELAAQLSDELNVYTGEKTPRELFGWTPRSAPHQPHIALSEFDDASFRWVIREGEKLLRTAAHEFGHRLQLDPATGPIVEGGGWEYDIDDGNCSSAVQKFGEFISKRYSGMVSLSDNWGRGYRDLAQKCRVKAGLSADPSVAELGMHHKFGLVIR